MGSSVDTVTGVTAMDVGLVVVDESVVFIGEVSSIFGVVVPVSSDVIVLFSVERTEGNVEVVGAAVTATGVSVIVVVVVVVAAVTIGVLVVAGVGVEDMFVVTVGGVVVFVIFVMAVVAVMLDVIVLSSGVMGVAGVTIAVSVVCVYSVKLV